MILDEGKVTVKTCDMVDGECPEDKARMKYELDCNTRLDDPAASQVSVKENIEAITKDPGVKYKVGEEEKEFKFHLDHCLEVIYKEDPKNPDDKP